MVQKNFRGLRPRTPALCIGMTDYFQLASPLLTRDGILTPVMNGEWVSPIVVVPKTDGRVKICEDNKVSVNLVLDVDQYSLPSIEDIFATLSVGVYFSKLDLSYAYQ